MSLFKKTKQATPVSAREAPTMPVPTTAPGAGKISLEKGSRISLEKHADTISVSNGWTARGKDYDLKALVRYHDGRQIYIGAANKDEVLRTPEGAVSHGGDAREPGELETITITWHSDIASVALSSYSAISNGEGSFRKYGVYVNIQNGPQVISLNAADASADGQSYTLCFGEIIFEPNGAFNAANLEMYSSRRSERRIGYRGDRVVMDIGPEGKSK